MAKSKRYSIALTADEESANTWYGLYAYGKTYKNSANSVKSSMMWGSQYDAMMRWMEQEGENVTVPNDSIKKYR